MKNIGISLALLLVSVFFLPGSYAQNYIANGELITKSSHNRLISVKSENGKQLYQQKRRFFEQNITVDGKMDEPEWEKALLVTPFLNENGEADNSAVRVLYDRANIYLLWSVRQSDGLTVNMKEKDGVITSDDYIQVDLKPWLPDNIVHGRDYSYSIAVNPDGVIWDSYFDPYLGGYYFSSWDSEAEVSVHRESDSWQIEMIIPFSELDVYADPGWKWNLEFHHGTQDGGTAYISSSNMGVTVQQDTMVRESGLVSYYWPRPNFMQEVKPDLSLQEKKVASVVPLRAVPKVNKKEDRQLWNHSKPVVLNHGDKMGNVLNSNLASAAVGISGNFLCFNLKAEGAKIEKKASSKELGDAMAAQTAGVNGVFVDQALFQNDCFWIELQPRNSDPDVVHHDYYLIVVNNRGEIKGTHYDRYGEPKRSWEPGVKLDFYNTGTGWGSELILDLRTLDIPVDYSDSWGINIFRNRLLENEGSELQVWKYSGNDFLNPAKFGLLSGMPVDRLSIVQSSMERRLTEYSTLPLPGIKSDLKSIKINTKDQLEDAEKVLESIDNKMGVLQSSSFYQSAPHPAFKGGFSLMDVTFVGRKGWAVGALGTVLLSVDGGENWEKVPMETNADFYRVEFVDENEGWIAGGRLRLAESNESMRHDQRGGYGYIYHTVDGGKTWTCQYAERGRHLFGLDFIDKNIGYACGERGFLLKTTDGGEHWYLLPTTGTMNWLYGMEFKDKLTGFAVGLNETLLKTSDGGKTWKMLDASADKQFYGYSTIYRDISIKGNTACIVGQNGTILVSSDGGETWNPSATFYHQDVRELMDLRHVEFVTPLRGYAVGELGSKIMTTEDGGQNWTYRNTGHTEWLRAVWGDPSGKVIVVGERESVLSSEDKGMTWNVLKGEDTKTDIMVLLAHGDDAAIHLNSFFAHYSINEGKRIVDVGVMSDVHSSEYEETYNLEHDRNIWMTGIGATTNFCQFETGNKGANYYHYNLRLWEGEKNVVRRMVAAIRAYKPDILITHDGVFGDYDKPGHKLSGRAGLMAFESAGGEVDLWPELTRLGLEPWQPSKLYCLESQSYPGTLDLEWIGEQPLSGTDMSCEEYGNYIIRNFQSQGIYFHDSAIRLGLVKSMVPVPEKEETVFDGLINK